MIFALASKYVEAADLEADLAARVVDVLRDPKVQNHA